MGKILFKFPRSVSAYKSYNIRAGGELEHHQVQHIHWATRESYYLARQVQRLTASRQSAWSGELELNHQKWV